MPWTCPACGTSIHHRNETLGQRMTYRCAVCRLELVADVDTGKMTVAPLPSDRPLQTPSKTVAPLPTEAHDARPSRKKRLAKPSR